MRTYSEQNVIELIFNSNFYNIFGFAGLLFFHAKYKQKSAL